MKMFKKTVIIGTGLIGGSLGLALKKKHLTGRVVGLSRRLKNARLAKKIGAIDQVGVSLEAVRDADLVILAVPIEAILNIAKKIAKKLKKDCIVMDVGSTKEKIVSKLSAIIPNFLGCHPLAGSEKRGAANILEKIFEGSLCILTPDRKTKKDTLRKIKLLWAKLGAQTIILSPKKHDQVLAFTSHLPHAIAFSLIDCVPRNFLNLSSSGLKDTTRIAGSDEALWGEIFLSNRANLLKALSIFQMSLAALKLALENQDKSLLVKILKAAKNKREKLG